MRGLLFTSIAIVLVAVSAPSVLTRYIEPERAGARTHDSNAASREQAAREAVQSQERSYPAGRQVVVRAARDGHFYVDAQVNFRRVRLMVDTGATVVALRRSDAAAAGIRPQPGDFRHPVQTANGTTAAAEAVLASVMVDDIAVHNVRALILPDEQLAISLLGGSFLHGLERFEVSDGTLILED